MFVAWLVSTYTYSAALVPIRELRGIEVKPHLNAFHPVRRHATRSVLIVSCPRGPDHSLSKDIGGSPVQ